MDFARSSIILFLISAWAMLFSVACSPEIGDSCVTGQECGTGAYCDTSAPDGYCIISPCERGGCPEEAVCVEFDGDITACMLRCDANGDCRDDYVCRSEPGPVNFCYVE